MLREVLGEVGGYLLCGFIGESAHRRLMSLHSRHSGSRGRGARRYRTGCDGARAHRDCGARHFCAFDVSLELEYSLRSTAAHLVNLDATIELRGAGSETDNKPLQAIALVHVQELAIDDENVSFHRSSARKFFDGESQLLKILSERTSQIMRDGMRSFELTFLRRPGRLNFAERPMDDALI